MQTCKYSHFILKYKIHFTFYVDSIKSVKSNNFKDPQVRSA